MRHVFIASDGPCLHVLFMTGPVGKCWTMAMARMRELKVDTRGMSPEHNLIPVPAGF